MTQQQALAETQKRWGRGGVVEFNKKGCTKVERDVASAALKAHREAKPRAPDLAWRKRERELMGVALSYRYRVGQIISMPGFGGCFEVRGEGDSWEEAFTQAERLKF